MNPCTKTCYGDKRAATTAMKGALNRRRNNPGKLRSYYCDECHAWHLTKLDASAFKRSHPEASRSKKAPRIPPSDE